MHFIIRFILTALAIYLLIDYQYLQWVTLSNGASSLLVFTAILGLVNMTIGSLLRIITFPIRWLSLGIIGSGISLLVVRLADEAVPGVTIVGWLPYIIIAIVMGIISAVMG
jgi:putative membrane protein